MPAVELINVTKNFGEQRVIQNLSAAVEPGHALCLFGPSGCGKTTLLRLIAGLEKLDVGAIRIADVTVNDEKIHIPPMARNVGMVFQHFALWPHLRVERHLDLVLRARHITRQQRRADIDVLLALVGLEKKRRAYPNELSGGEQQRLDNARALATRPRVLLLDEPFAHLDAALRVHIAEDIERRMREDNLTVVVATHDLDEIAQLNASVFQLG